MTCPRCGSKLTIDEESVLCTDPDCNWRPTELWDENVAGLGSLFAVPYLGGEPT